jgi:hypothetical protein
MNKDRIGIVCVSVFVNVCVSGQRQPMNETMNVKITIPDFLCFALSRDSRTEIQKIYHPERDT